MTSQPPGPWVEGWLSSGRFGIYLTAAAGDRKRALELYEWNATVSASFQHDLAHLEVALRNAYDAALIAGTPAGRPHWTTEPYRVFPVLPKTAQNGTPIDANKTPRDQLERAVREAGVGAPPGKVIAELMFGFGATCPRPRTRPTSGFPIWTRGSCPPRTASCQSAGGPATQDAQPSRPS
jgi:hypothetical protein